MVKRKKGTVIKGRRHYDLGFEKGTWLNTLVQNQDIKGVFLKSFATDSDYKNTREGSECFGKKKKLNYSFRLDKGKGVLNISETGGRFQALLDDLEPGDYFEGKYLYIKREDGAICPRTVTTGKQLKKWKQGQKAYPQWDKDAYVTKGRG